MPKILFKKKDTRLANGKIIKSNTIIKESVSSSFKALYGKYTKEQQKNILQAMLYEYMIKEAYFKYKKSPFEIMKSLNYDNIDYIINVLNIGESVKYIPNQNGKFRAYSELVH